MGHNGEKQLPTLQLNTEKWEGKLKAIGGSKSDDWNHIMVNQVVQALWVPPSEASDRDAMIVGNMGAMVGIAPQDVVEGMMAGQLVAAHNAAMECYRRAMIPDQTFEGRRENLIQANKLSRTFALVIEALNRHRGKGQQKVTVEHVHVHAGAQAVVGVLNAGEGDAKKVEEQPHAELQHQDDLPMRSQDARREPVPIGGDGER